MMKLTFLNFIW